MLGSSRVSGFPVINQAGKVIGVVSETDMLIKEADQAGHPRLFAGLRRSRDHEKAAGVTAAQLMTSPPVTIGPDEPAQHAACLFVPSPVVAVANAQVAARVTLQLADLAAALATGAVGSVALVRSDISDTLPGVAIAISLVPPLAVVGLTLESGALASRWPRSCCSPRTSRPSWPAASWSWPCTGSAGPPAGRPPRSSGTAATSPSSPSFCWR